MGTGMNSKESVKDVFRAGSPSWNIVSDHPQRPPEKPSHPKALNLPAPKVLRKDTASSTVSHGPMWSDLTKCGVMKTRDKGKSLTTELKCVMHVRGFWRRALELHGATSL